LKTDFSYWGLDTTGGYYGRLYRRETLPQAGGNDIQNVRHTWDAGGNLSTRQDVLASETETFSYDSLDRLTAVSGAYTYSVSYDEIGNITNLNGNAYSYGSKPHAVTSVGSTSCVYDSNGNMTTRGAQTITWDVENRPTTVTGGASFVYDGDGNRVKKTEGGETTLYINKCYEKNLTTGVITSSYYLGDRLIAQKENTTLRYIHQDSLGSSSVVSNSSGTSVGSVKYYPFGACLQSQGTPGTDKLFTGQRLDETGLYYYGARYYDPTIGRFISPDTVVQQTPESGAKVIDELVVSLSGPKTFNFRFVKAQEVDYINPQEHNRYSYVLNNPLKYHDPAGSMAQVAAAALTTGFTIVICIPGVNLAAIGIGVAVVAVAAGVGWLIKNALLSKGGQDKASAAKGAKGNINNILDHFLNPRGGPESFNHHKTEILAFATGLYNQLKQIGNNPQYLNEVLSSFTNWASTTNTSLNKVFMDFTYALMSNGYGNTMDILRMLGLDQATIDRIMQGLGY
jgi:RHS repeat-associated protein